MLLQPMFHHAVTRCEYSICEMITHENENSAVSYNSAVKQTIFAVEDDTDISRLVRHHLEGAGYAVRTFTSASGVVAEAEKQPPSLFLLDIMIPGGDGL